ncbi:MAG: glycoside hydrolase family 2, partial [Bacilli bacterium]|nr:glycoside hydrolase family 2 [Bacilli bacterium]
KKESFKCWYVQTTGIWKSVWLEFVKPHYLLNVKNTPNYDTEDLSLVVETNILMEEFAKHIYELCVEIFDNGNVINKKCYELMQNNQELNISIYADGGVSKKWGILSPNIYDIKYTLFEDGNLTDTVNSYFGVRKIEIKKDKIYLNGEELYQKLILDQGYWKESHLTLPNEEALINDIDNIVRFGYNGVRKHQKNEDERFLSLCDKKGLLVWSEMANCYEFTDDAILQFSKEWMNVLKQNYNHPSIITWVPINESWGVPNVRASEKEQAYINQLYYLTKAFDNTRPVICNDGWEHTISDIITIHDYKQEAKELEKLYTVDKAKVFDDNINYNGDRSLMASGYSYNGQPVIMSEYGGIALVSDSGWGYGKQVSTEEELFERFEQLTNSIKQIDYLSGYCYTQLT